MIKIAPSLLAADFTRLGEEVARVERGGADYLHLDVMDGCFVPNISFGPDVIGALRKGSGLFFDVHLMIDEPIRYLERFKEAGADLITVHVESCADPLGTLRAIRSMGLRSSVSIKPSTSPEALRPLMGAFDMALVMSVEPGFGGQKFMPETLESVRALREMRRAYGLHYEIEIDGGINPSTARDAIEAGCDVLVAGSAIFRASDPAQAIDALRHAGDTMPGI